MMGLCILLFGGILLLGLWADVKGRKEKGLRRYRGIRWIERRWRKKQWIIPEWLQPHMIFRTWVLLLIGSGCLTLGAFQDNGNKSGSYGAETTRVWTRKQADRVVFRGGR